MDTNHYLNREQDLDHKNFKMENRIICPKCMKAYLLKEILYSGTIFGRKKIISFYCPLCDFRNDKKFKINENQYQEEYR